VGALAGRYGIVSLSFCLGTAVILYNASAEAKGSARPSSTKITELDRAEQIQTEYVQAVEKACSAGNLANCEEADEARDGLNLFKTSRGGCVSGDGAACARMDKIAPLVIQSAEYACETIALPSCPGKQELAQPQESETTTDVPEESSNPAATSAPGVVIVNGQPVSPAGGASAPPPH